MRDHVRRPQPARGRREEFDHRGGEIEGVDVLAERALYARAQHLDRHRLAGAAQPRLVDLGDRGGGDGFAQLVEHLVDGAAQLVRDAAARGFQRKGRQLVLKDAQLARQIVADDVGPCGKHLPELDIGRAQRRQRAQRRRHAGIAAIAQPLERPGQKAHRAAHQRRRVHRIEKEPHRAGALERGAGADEAQYVVRAAHALRSSSPNAGRRRRRSGCGRRRFRSPPCAASPERSPDRESGGSIRPGTGNCRGRARSPAPGAG